ncbi:MAG: Serine/threonine-protein kinase pkn1 [Planctomycetota bacterium]|jgi:formylglycine-generating enzyme required for sulfatase activity
MRTLQGVLLLLCLTVAEGAVLGALPGGDALDQQVLEIFRNRCVVCHDSRPADAAGGVSDLLNLGAIVDPKRGYIVPGDPAASYLRTLIVDGSMPKRTWKPGVDWTGELTELEKAALLRWIDRGGASAGWQEQLVQAAEPPRQMISEREQVQLILGDLQGLKGRQLANARYLTLTNLYNMNSISADRLQLFREGLVKALNSLSRSANVLGLDGSPAVRQVTAVDPRRTIFRFDLSDIGWTAAEWELVLQHYPYAMLHSDGAGRGVYGATSSQFPYMRADWFCFAALQPPLYHELVRIPQSLETLDERLGVQRTEGIRERRVMRAGLAHSGVSRSNRLLERHTSIFGYYHISYDFGRNDGVANFFENPYGPPGLFSNAREFQHDGGEVIFRMSNGFQGYALVKSDGQRLSVAPSAIVFDNSMPGATIINGISCISCHYDGMKPENPAAAAALDGVRQHAVQNPAQFNVVEQELLQELYPEAATFGRQLEEDRQSYREAMRLAGIRLSAEEPCRALFDEFARNVTLEAAAADFGMAPEVFRNHLNRSDELRRLSGRLGANGVQRQMYVTEFRRLAELVGPGAVRHSRELLLPFFGGDPDAAAAVAGAGQPARPDATLTTGTSTATAGTAATAPSYPAPAPVQPARAAESMEAEKVTARRPEQPKMSPPAQPENLGIGVRLVSLPGQRLQVSATEVTQGQWFAVMGTRPWQDLPDAPQGDAFPAVGISWNAACEFCERLSDRTNTTVRLPLESEWLAAAEAGTGALPPFLEGQLVLSQFAWYHEGDEPAIAPEGPYEVGMKQANALGLFDLHGNVWEWCADSRADDQSQATGRLVTEPTSVESLEGYRVLRGGSFLNDFETVASCDRTVSIPEAVDASVGFRIVVD